MTGRNTDGFLQEYNNPYIKEVMFYYTGNCRIKFQNGIEKEYTFCFDAVYLSQFGAPISDDGRLLFISDWEHGLSVFDTDTGEQCWHYKATRIGKVLVFPSFVLAEKFNERLIQFDIRTGKVMNQIKSGTIEELFYLTEKEVLVCSVRGKVSLVDAATLHIIKCYSNKETNPSDCLSQVIRDARMVDGEIVLYGFESCSHRNFNDRTKVDFQRALPTP